MTVPSLLLTDRPPLDDRADESVSGAAPAAIVLGVRKGADGPEPADPHGLAPDGATLARIGVTGGVDEVVRLPGAPGGPILALVGLGPAAPTADSLRYAAGAAARSLTGLDHLAFALPTETAEQSLAVLEGAAIGAYQFLDYRVATNEATRRTASVITVHGPGGDDVVARAAATAAAVHTVRDFVSTPASDLYPESFADRTLELAAELPIDVEVLDEEALEAGGYGGILGVGRGSVRPPRLVVVRYAPEGTERHVALVGKGITFDSGGLSLKPAVSMVGMKYDMTGAATVLAVVLAAARLGLPVRLTAWLCLAENMPSGAATRPNDVLRIRGGKTVEVLNTDAEGRLVLADGIVAAGEEQPDAIIDVATLTGAAKVAMGERTIPVMGDEALGTRLVEAGAAVGETFWRMPLPPEIRPLLDSDIADLANARPGNAAGGMMLAGHFLKAFVGTTGTGPDATPIPWAHLDIAGAANNGGRPYGFVTKGATGASVRTLLEYVRGLGA